MANLARVNILLLTIFAIIVAGQPINDDDITPDARKDGRIVGGYEVDITRHPHQVAMRRKGCEACSYTHHCGGSIYNEWVIVTAAHCVNGRKKEDFIVVAGTVVRNGVIGVVARISEIIMHDKYNLTITDYDVALLILATPLPLNAITMSPIELASEIPPHGAKATISGWGTTSPGGDKPIQMLAVDVPIVSNERCDSAYGPGRISDAMLCAGLEGVGGKDACQGYSGGPLVVNGKLTGIVSWGYGCARPAFPGVYANVPHVRQWILDTAAANV
ncbi:trypsin eta-like [Musca vetustissima]|uniref:trypsin eta-like n=1 Tax=Musca vetustissima TaxID=27455 RepID=UPI002AB7C8C8|nr:trypsin eta-like [Musca vetustissima]